MHCLSRSIDGALNGGGAELLSAGALKLTPPLCVQMAWRFVIIALGAHYAGVALGQVRTLISTTTLQGGDYQTQPPRTHRTVYSV